VIPSILAGNDGAGLGRIVNQSQRIFQDAHLKRGVIRPAQRPSRLERTRIERSRRPRRFGFVG